MEGSYNWTLVTSFENLILTQHLSLECNMHGLSDLPKTILASCYTTFLYHLLLCVCISGFLDETNTSWKLVKQNINLFKGIK